MKNRKRYALILSVVCLCILGYYAYLTDFWSNNDVRIEEGIEYLVAYVVDGDTFKAKIGRKTITVRMLGINTPETVDPRKPAECYGHEASEETRSLLVGHTVRLKANPNREKKDRYGRYLLYVYQGDLFVNKYLVQDGFAREYTYGKAYSFQDEFKKVEGEARAEKKGLWAVCPVI
ncbi:MAG: thermonuclease family protein [Candidatus Paceibacterota bacterium]